LVIPNDHTTKITEVKFLKILRQLALILFFLLAGEALRLVSGISIPGTVLGMVLLFLALMTKLIRLEQIDLIAKFLLDHLAFLFVPAGVGLMSSWQVIGKSWLPILLIVLFSTILVVGVTGWTVQLMKRRGTR
jgi:holin-like protein